MSHGLVIAMGLSTLAAILAGYRIAFVLAGSSAIFILISDLPLAFFNLIVTRVYANVLSNWLLVAIPMFIFMGLILEKSGVAERSMQGARRALGGSAAGMGIAALLIGLILAAASGIVGASVVLLAMLALPALKEAGYSNRLAGGLVASSGTLAILLPPSIMLIVLADQLQTSVPAMFGAAIGPGLVLVGLYAVFIIVATFRMPKPPKEEKVSISRSILIILRDTAPLVILAVCVLGSILTGMATPTEASGIGALSAIAITIIYKKFSLNIVMEAARDTVITTAMVLAVLIGATCFSAVFRGIGGDDAIQNALSHISSGPWMTLTIVMIVIFFLGMVLDWLEITLILMPIFGPLITGLDFGNGLDPQMIAIWFGVLVAINLQTSFITPPFGFSLFYLKGVTGDQLTNSDLYLGVLPFIVLQLLALLLVMLFPSIAVGLF